MFEAIHPFEKGMQLFDEEAISNLGLFLLPSGGDWNPVSLLDIWTIRRLWFGRGELVFWAQLRGAVSGGFLGGFVRWAVESGGRVCYGF